MNMTHRRAFNDQRHHATRRGIAFELTFQQWLRIWGDKIGQRGRGVGKLCMARKGDCGPYAVGNVKIITCDDNSREHRGARGVRNGNAKLTLAKVRRIRKLYKPRSPTHGLVPIAKMFGVGHMTVRQIVRYETWV